LLRNGGQRPKRGGLYRGYTEKEKRREGEQALKKRSLLVLGVRRETWSGWRKRFNSAKLPERQRADPLSTRKGSKSRIRDARSNLASGNSRGSAGGKFYFPRRS